MFMQFTYFEAQGNKCMTASPDLYFWLMFQILVIWVGFAVIVCHFFRKYCQEEPNPQDISPGDIEEDFLGYNPNEVHDFSIQYANISSPIFTDKDFPANDRSVKGTNPAHLGDFNGLKNTYAGWTRASKFPGADKEQVPELFKDGTEPNDIA